MNDLEFLIAVAAFLILVLPVTAIIMVFMLRSRVKRIDERTRIMAEAAGAGRSGPTPSAETSIIAEWPWHEYLARRRREEAADLAEQAGQEKIAEAASVETGEAEPSKGPWSDLGKSDTPPEQAAPAKKSGSFEEAIGARWSVILGGIAIALGAIFLVRYTIEAGLLGPAARVALGFVTAIALFAAGEWLRRRDKRMGIPVFEKADIPGILTGAGAIAAFASLYAAHALYGFVGPAFAFAGLTAIGLASVILASLHGPKLAAIGLLGSYATPLLVSSAEPNPIALALHVLVTTVTVLGTARMRQWLWLAFAGIAGGVAWTCLASTISGPIAGLAGAGLIIGLALAFVGTFGWDIAERPHPPRDRAHDKPALIAYSALVFAFAAHLALNASLPIVFVGLALSSILMAAACIWPAHAGAAIISSIAVILAAAGLDLPRADLPGLIQGAELKAGLVPPDIPGYLIAMVTIAAPAALLAVFTALRFGQTAVKTAGWLAAGAGSSAFFVVVIAYLRIAPFETRPLFGAVSLGLAAIFAWLTDQMQKRRPDDWKAPAPAAFAVAAVALTGFALAVSLTKGWLPLAFAATALGISWLYRWRPIAVLPWLAVAAAIIGAYALWQSAPFPALEIGKTPFLNAFIILAGLPSILLLAAGENLRRLEAEQAGAVVTTFGLAALGLFIGLELRHWLHDGEIINAPFTLADMAAQTIAALSFALGLQKVAALTRAKIYDIASLAVGAVSVLMIASGLGVRYNPFFVDEPVGEGRIFNMLFIAYLVPGLLAGLVALAARPVRPRWYTLGYAALSGMLMFLYATAMVRHGFQGTDITIWRSTTDLEFWVYSAVWLAIGGGLLLAGFVLKSQPIRIASGLVIALTVCKVFLLDMSALTGPLRAFSFIGLGLCLVAIGRLYQRLLLPGLSKKTEGS